MARICNLQLNFIILPILRECKTVSGGRARPHDLNVKCGTIVDTQLVSATRKEFFLNAHKTIQV